jgi:hypothetical protein
VAEHSGRDFCESDYLPARSVNTKDFFGHLRQYRESEESFSLLCDAVYSDISLATFRRNLRPQSWRESDATSKKQADAGWMLSLLLDSEDGGS